MGINRFGKLLFVICIGCAFLQHSYAAHPGFSDDDWENKINKFHEVIAKERFDEVDKILKSMLEISKISGFRLSPYADFMDRTAIPSLDILNKWIVKNDKSEFAYYLRAYYYYNAGWKTRGNQFSEKVLIGNALKFQDYMELAERDVRKSLELNDKMPGSHSLLMRIYTSIGTPAMQEGAFKNAIAHFPSYYTFYETRLEQLEPKWGGSTMSEIAFASYYSTNAAKDSPLKMLPFSLYVSLAENFDINCSGREASAKESCKRDMLDFLKNPTMQNQLKEAFGLYNEMDHFAYNSKVLAICGDCLAKSMIATEPLFSTGFETLGKDNYALNYKYASLRKWDDPSQSIIYLNKALQDVQTFPFAYAKDKNEQLALVYNEMSDAHNRLRQYQKALDASNNAIKIFPDSGYFFVHRCQADVGLQDYEGGAADCSKAINLGVDTYNVRSLRGFSYQYLSKYPEAESDYETALSMSKRDGSAEETLDTLDRLVTLYGHAEENRKIIDMYTAHPELMRRGQIYAAGNYAILCHANTEVGEYKEAFQDCDKAIALGDPRGSLYKSQLLKKTGFGSNR